MMAEVPDTELLTRYARSQTGLKMDPGNGTIATTRRSWTRSTRQSPCCRRAPLKPTGGSTSSKTANTPIRSNCEAGLTCPQSLIAQTAITSGDRVTFCATPRRHHPFQGWSPNFHSQVPNLVSTTQPLAHVSKSSVKSGGVGSAALPLRFQYEEWPPEGLPAALAALMNRCPLSPTSVPPRPWASMPRLFESFKP